MRFLDLIHFKYGEALMTAGRFDRAAQEFLASASARARSRDWRPWRISTPRKLWIWRASVTTRWRNTGPSCSRPNVYDAHDQAQTGLKEAYKRKLTVDGTHASGEPSQIGHG